MSAALAQAIPAVKEHPILFSGEMVRAILEGRKTQTRRVIKSQPGDAFPMKNQDNSLRGDFFLSDPVYTRVGRSENFCPYGKIGDRLWVREAASLAFIDKDSIGLNYAATENAWDETVFDRSDPGPYKLVRKTPAIHMPRWASRLMPEITKIRVERVQAITCTDAIAEGIDLPDSAAKQGYRELWDKINAARGFGWEKNPWVWVIEFRRVA